jgi:hypothetical protein
MKPTYFKAPFQIVTEYRCTVYAKDLFGRIFKVSKNNIKKASVRSAELFSRLPEDIKLVLGHPINPELWETIAREGKVPEYLQDINLYEKPDRMLRGQLPIDTHLLETVPEPLDINTVNPLDETETDDDIFDQMEEGHLLNQLRELHRDGDLNDDNLTLRQIPDYYQTIQNNIVQPGRLDIIDDVLPDDVDEDDPVDVDRVVRPEDDGHHADVHPSNILPEGTRRSVRFNLPVLR